MVSLHCPVLGLFTLVRIIPYLFVFFLGACSQRLIEKERLKSINEHYEGKLYMLKEDVQLSSNDLIKAGVPLKIYIESTPTLLKIKCFPAQESRETSVGKLVHYVINEQTGKKTFGFEDVDPLVQARFTEYDPKAKKPGKK